MKRTQFTLEQIADKAGISIEELFEIAKREPQIATLLVNVPRGLPDSGIPPDPSMYGKLIKYLSDSDEDDED